MSKAFWAGQRVLLTGHTGFKGAWLSLWLEQLGAEVAGLALVPDTEPNLYGLLAPFAKLSSHIDDIRDLAAVRRVVEAANPTVAIHMAAQPLVRRSFREPVETADTNILGTVNVLQALREAPALQAVLVITTDKVYRNLNEGRAFREGDPLGGHDPYSASKAAAEIMTESFAASFFASRGVSVATARAGNVIGGGDWSEDRLIPDLWRAFAADAPVTLRYPQATRPWQHVLEPLAGYLAYAERLAHGAADLPRALNFGPAADDILTVGEVCERALAAFGSRRGWIAAEEGQPPEMMTLSLDATLAQRAIGWRPKLDSGQALAWTVDWYRAFRDGADARAVTLRQIEAYEAIP